MALHSIVYVDDAAAARPVLQTLLRTMPPQGHCLVVACAPRITHRVSKWVSHRSREQWRERWADRLWAELAGTLEPHRAHCTLLLAREPLTELSARWQREGGGTAAVVDARRTRDASSGSPANRWPHWAPGTLASLLLGWSWSLD